MTVFPANSFALVGWLLLPSFPGSDLKPVPWWDLHIARFHPLCTGLRSWSGDLHSFFKDQVIAPALKIKTVSIAGVPFIMDDHLPKLTGRK